MLYEFPRTPELAGLSIRVEREHERVRARLDGPWGRWRSHLVSTYFAWLNRVKPLRIDGREGIWSLYFPPVPSSAHNAVLESYLTTLVVKRQTPAAVTIAVTDACQYTCRHCSAAKVGAANGRRGNPRRP